MVQDVRDRVVSRKSVHSAIAPFVPPSVCTLHLDTVRKVRAYRVPHSGKAGGDGKVVEEESSSLELPEGVPPSEEPPLRLSLEASPDFMQLPLEFQVRGYSCHRLRASLNPWDVVAGILLSCNRESWGVAAPW